MRSYKKIMPVILTVALLGSAAYSFKTKMETRSVYENKLQTARDYAAMGLGQKASEQYEEALEISRSLPLEIEIGNFYLASGDVQSARRWYEDVLLSDYPKEADSYYFGMRCYEQRNSLEDMYRVYEEYQGRELYMEEVEKLSEKYRYSYRLQGVFEDCGVFNNASALVPVRYEGKWGVINRKGNQVLYYNYDSIGLVDEFTPAITIDGRAICFDLEGKERVNESLILANCPEFMRVTEFRNEDSGLILASNGTEWGYFETESCKLRFGGFSDAMPINEGAGPVRKGNSLWQMISDKGEELTPPKFEEVLADRKQIACRNGVVIAKENGVYNLYDINGNQVGSGGYSDAKAFNDNSLAAVKKDGLWLFVNQQGEEKNLGDFTDAESFSGGLAAVEKDGKWGYIDENGTMVIENVFYGAMPMARFGVSFVAQQPDEWSMLSIISQNY